MDLGGLGKLRNTGRPTASALRKTNIIQALHYIKSLEFVRWEHYEFRYSHGNRWAFLGNGQVQAEIMKNRSQLTPYIRNADEPWHIV